MVTMAFNPLVFLICDPQQLKWTILTILCTSSVAYCVFVKQPKNLAVTILQLLLSAPQMKTHHKDLERHDGE